MKEQQKKKVGRPLIYVPDGRLKVRGVSLDSESSRRLKRLGHGNLSAGIRMAAASRSFKRYHQMVEAAQGIVEAYDMDKEIGPAINDLVCVITEDDNHY